MHSTEPRAISIALLYQAQGHSEHLKLALTDLGATVVYDSPAANFDRAALDASGARIVVINLDEQSDDGLDPFDNLLTDAALHVVINDAEVSSRLQGSDQARWARHLAAKILGRGELNPPRPPGAKAVPVRVKTQPRQTDSPKDPERGFELHGAELDAALAADTGESLQRTRAALVTADEPVAAQLVDPFARASARHDAPTVVLPVVDAQHALAAEAVAPARHDAPTVELRLPDLQVEADKTGEAAQAPIQSAQWSAGDALDDDFESISMSDPGELPITRAPDGSIDADLDDFDSLALDAEPAAPAAPSKRESGLAQALDLDPEFAASLRDFGLLPEPGALTATTVEDDAAAVNVEGPDTGMALTDEFDEALGALSFEPLDDDTPSQRESAPAGLDDLLLDLQSESPSGEDPPQAPVVARAAPPPPPPPFPSSSGLSLSLAEDGDAAAAPAPQAAAPSSAPLRSVTDFDLSGLSLEPLGDEDTTPITGRAKFEIDEKDRRAANLPPVPVPVPAAEPVAAANTGDDFDGSIEFEQRGLREPAVDPELAAELEAMVAAANVLPLGQPVATSIQNIWVLGASIGGPEAVREFLAALPPATPAVFLLAQHMGADFLDMMVQQLARATPMPVRTVGDGDIARHGDVLVVPLTERLLIDRDGRIRVEAVVEASPYSPSIDRVLRDTADRFGPAAGAIIFSGMAHDAVEGATYMRERGGTIWVQDPATCVISSMVDGAQDAGVVSFVGAPAELAQELGTELTRRAARE